MSIEKPKISVVTVVLNAPAEIQKTLSSITGQDHADLEIIIIDGGSTDNTKQVLEQFRGRLDYSISEPDKGIYDAMNKGLAKASGEWVIFLNAGDVFKDRQVLSRVFDHDYTGTDIIYGDSIADYKHFKVHQKANPIADLWKGMPFCHQAMFSRTALLRKSGFSSEYKIAADFDLVFRLYCEKVNFHYVPETICIFDAQGISNQHYIKSWKERYSIYKKYGNVSAKEKLFYAVLFVIFLFTWLGYTILPRALMHRIVRIRNGRNVIGQNLYDSRK